MDEPGYPSSTSPPTGPCPAPDRQALPLRHTPGPRTNITGWSKSRTAGTPPTWTFAWWRHTCPVFSSDHVGAVFFDVDGTLVPGTSSGVFLAGFLGHQDMMAKAEDGYASGVLDNRQVCELDAAGWSGVPEEQVSGWLDGLPLVSGITETVTWCRQNGLAPVLATLAWSPVGSYLADRFGFHAFSGPRLETAGGRFTGRVARHFDEHDKRDFALTQARELGLSPRSCGAVGDSRSDLPLFASVGLSVAFNASAGARAAATAAVDDDDLRAVLPLLSGLVTATRSWPHSTACRSR